MASSKPLTGPFNKLSEDLAEIDHSLVAILPEINDKFETTDLAVEFSQICHSDDAGDEYHQENQVLLGSLLGCDTNFEIFRFCSLHSLFCVEQL